MLYLVDKNVFSCARQIAEFAFDTNQFRVATSKKQRGCFD